jgi:polyphosphate kinase
VTVFVELKARFDEENNLATAEMMKHAGIRIIFSIPGLKVHAKVALVLRRNAEGKQMRSYAYISTGNFNEQTAKLYADSGLFTANETIVNDLHTLFRVLSQEVKEPKFKRLLVARFNLLDELKKHIDYEIAEAKAGREGRIILKMNALQDPAMISELYRASEAGVEIDLIVRGICCLIPGQPYSRHIRVTRIVDMFLEHARVWYFRHGGHEKVYIGSPDWMRRNLYRRIEAVTPILHDDLKQELIQMLRIQLADNQKAGWVDDQLRNILKRDPEAKPVRAQWDFYEYLKGKNKK